MQWVNAGLDFYAGLMLAILLVSRQNKYEYNPKIPKKSFDCLLIAGIVMLISAGLANVFEEETAGFFYLITTAAFYGLQVLYARHLLFAAEKRGVLFGVIMMIVSGLSVFACILWGRAALIEVWRFTNMPFDLSYVIYQIPGAGVVLIDLLVIILFGSNLRWSRKLVYCFLPLLPLVSVFESFLIPGLALRMPLIALSLVALYLFTQVQLNQELEQKRYELEQSRIANALARLRPHFIYNVLATIYYLCEQDPKRAQSALEKFSRYLRVNLDQLGQENLIPFGEEVEHIDNYLELEKIRYGERLVLETEIEAEGFLLPAMTLQPIVENAVKHGMKRDGSRLTIRLCSRQAAGVFIVEVKDDGCGFDPDQIREGHGLQQVSARLKLIPGAAMEIESRKGVGSRVSLLIPERGGEKKDSGSWKRKWAL